LALPLTVNEVSWPADVPPAAVMEIGPAFVLEPLLQPMALRRSTVERNAASLQQPAAAFSYFAYECSILASSLLLSVFITPHPLELKLPSMNPSPSSFRSANNFSVPQTGSVVLPLKNHRAKAPKLQSGIG
jgi:hypothetical protein